jgi:GT2 family glycosyltransferase/glycosyltransferase involved in cell wall biosynthesis
VEGPISAQRGDVAVVIPLYGGHDLFMACLRSVLRHTPPEVPVLVCDDASPDARSREFIAELQAAQPARALHYLRQPHNRGFPGNVNAGFAAAAPADVIILNSDCEVGAGWAQRLADAAYSDSTVATATALTNHGTIVSTPSLTPGPLPAEWTIDQAAAAVAAVSLQLRPRLPTAVGHCVYVRRAALELVGGFDLAFSPGYGEEVDFSQRCLQVGLCHIVADDVFVLHHGGSSFDRTGRKSEIQLEHEEIINARYPYYAQTVKGVERELGQLARAVGVARRALSGMHVLVDVRVLAGATTGTQIHAVELLGALARTERLTLTALIPDSLSVYGAASLRRLGAVELISRREAEAQGSRFDVVHRPFQINNFDDLALLRRLADRLVVTNQDLIGYHNPAYFADYDGWAGYRHITRAALSSADSVLFFSEHARQQALAENLVEPSRTRVVHIGVNHVVGAIPEHPVAPRGLERLAPEDQVIVCIGTDFQHKNRVFALRVLNELRRRHHWSGTLVLAGPAVNEGSSRGPEAELLSLDSALSDAVVRLGALTEEEKAWLYRRASLVFYPTVHEGFGLVPFEAADHGRPCMWAAGTSLSEVLDDSASGIVAWDPVASATHAHELLSNPAAGAENVAAIAAAAAKLNWDVTAEGLLEAYGDAADQPPVPGVVSRLGGMSVDALDLSEDALNLIGPGGALPVEMQRPLLALATHRSVSGPVFATVRFGYRLGYALKQRRGAWQTPPPNPN